MAVAGLAENEHDACPGAHKFEEGGVAAQAPQTPALQVSLPEFTMPQEFALETQLC
jgi:hypothetical protein